MKKENLILVLMVILMTVIGVSVLLIQTTIPQTNLDKMFNQKVTIKNETPIIDSEYANLLEKSELYNRKNKKIADLYVTRTDHDYFYLELYVAIDLDDKVYAIEKKMTTKDDTSESYYPLVREYLLQNYGGLYYTNVSYIDGAAGATTIQVSRSIIKQSVTQVINYHQGLIPDNIADLLKVERYTLNDERTLGDIKVYDVTADDKDYTVYEHGKVGSFYDGFKTHNGKIVVLIAVDEDGLITHVSLPDDLYEHSGGNFYNQRLSHLELILNTNISDPLVDMETSPTTNSNGSDYLINEILSEIKEALK
ncbi:MAG: hypothetical protein WC907_02810 [Acholeplasmataceae bacterium]